MKFFLTALQIVAVISLIAADEAEACSCAAGILLTSPADGAVNVPTNAEIKVVGSNFDPSQVKLTLDGADVPLHVSLTQPTYARLRPTAPLQPLKEYVLELGENEAGIVGTPKFRTGPDVDEVAPSNGATSAPQRIDEGGAPFVPVSSCGETHGFRYAVAEGADDRSPPAEVLYNVYVSFDGGEPDLSAPLTAMRAGGIFFGESGCGVLPATDEMTVRFAAVDLAGNEAAPTEEVPAQSCGCTSTTTAGAASSLLVLIAVSWAASRRRRGS